jgi:uncharacterized repeat protein (TIGR02543 family)
MISKRLYSFFAVFALLLSSCSQEVEYVYVTGESSQYEVHIDGLLSGNTNSVTFYPYFDEVTLPAETVLALIKDITPIETYKFTSNTPSVILPTPSVSGYGSPPDKFVVLISEFFTDSVKVYFQAIPSTDNSYIFISSDSSSQPEDSGEDAITEDTIIDDTVVASEASSLVPVDLPYYNIALSVSDTYEFQTRQVGYTDQSVLEVGITNTGFRPTGKIHIQLSTPNDGIASPFLLSASSLASLEYNQTDVFKVATNIGLSPGIYTCLVAVYGDNDSKDVEVRIRFRVSSAPVAPVVFDLDGGNFKDSAQLTQNVVIGERLTEPFPPTKSGHSFAGWQVVTDIVPSDEYVFYDFSTPVYGPLSLLAVFVPTIYPVYFFSEGGSEVENPVIHASHGSLLSIQTTVRPGYLFLGWFTAAEGGEEWLFNRTVFSSLALYAHWQRTPYLIQYSNCSGISSVAAYYGSKLSKPEDPLKDNYLFDYWRTTDSSGQEHHWNFETDIVTNNHVLEAVFVESYYAIFDADMAGASAFTAKRVAKGAILSEPTPPVKSGLVFNGWYVKSTGIDSEIIDIIGISNPNAWLDNITDVDFTNAFAFNIPINGHIVLKAQWVANVSFDSSGGSNVYSVVVREGMALLEPDSPVRDGFVFDGWYTIVGSRYNFTSAVYSNFNLIAKWLVEITYMSEGYNPDPESVGAIASTDVPGTYGIVTVSKVSENGALGYGAYATRKGFTFVNWYTGPDNTGLLFNFSLPITEKITLYARWTAVTFTIKGDYSVHHSVATTEVVTHTITYDPTSNAAIVAAFKAIYDRPMAQGGYAFVGWFTEPQHINQFTMLCSQYFNITSNFTLYALWVPVYEIKVTSRSVAGPLGENGTSFVIYVKEGDLVPIGGYFDNYRNFKYPTPTSKIKGFYVDRGNQKWRFLVDRVSRSMELYAYYKAGWTQGLTDDWYY